MDACVDSRWPIHDCHFTIHLGNAMFGKKKPASEPKPVRKLLHDLRASQHAIRLNAEAAQTLAKKMPSAQAGRLQRHLQLLQSDLDKFRDQLETLAGIIKSGQ